MIATAKTLGARYVGTAWVPHPNGPMTVALAHDVARAFNTMGSGLKAQGLTFFYHIHGYEFKPGEGGVLPIDVLMKETDPDAVKFGVEHFFVEDETRDPFASVPVSLGWLQSVKY